MLRAPLCLLLSGCFILTSKDWEEWERLHGYETAFGFEMVALPAGTFDMGREDGDANESPVHTVTLSHAFWLGRTELTQASWALWTTEAGSLNQEPSYFSGCADCPVEQVRWEDVAQYANALSESEGLEPCYESDGSALLSSFASDPYACGGYRLPTEAEWEYAARAGEAFTYAGSDDLDEVAWTRSNSGEETHPVGGLSPNGWGLYDLSGNVWEWVGDWYDSDYYESSPSSDPAGPETGFDRVFRGGSWPNTASYAAVAFRVGVPPSSSGEDLGFRLARSSLDP